MEFHTVRNKQKGITRLERIEIACNNIVTEGLAPT